MVLSFVVLAAALSDGHTRSVLQHKAVVAHTALHTGLISVTAGRAMQVLTGGLAGRYAVSVMTVLWTGWGCTEKRTIGY